MLCNMQTGKKEPFEIFKLKRVGTLGLATLVQESTVTTISTTIKWIPAPPLSLETTTCRSGPKKYFAYGRKTWQYRRYIETMIRASRYIEQYHHMYLFSNITILNI